MGSAVVPLNRALLSSYRLYIVTIPLSTAWPKFAVQILTGFPTPQISYSHGEAGPFVTQCWGHIIVPAKWHLIPSNGFGGVHECDRETDGPRSYTSVAVGEIADAFSDVSA